MEGFFHIAHNGFVYDLWRFGAAESAEHPRSGVEAAHRAACDSASPGAAFVRIVPHY